MTQKEKLKKHAAAFFYSGMLISSVGNSTFTYSLIAFMLKAGYGLIYASLIVGLSRLVPILVSALLGQKTDNISARKLVLITEIGAALGSLGILWAWNLGPSAYWLMLGFALYRSVLLSLQTGSRAKISKQLGTAEYASQSRNAVWLNKATQGATLFAGILTWFAIGHVSFTTVLLFDAGTFVLNGVILFFLPTSESAAETTLAQGIFDKFRNLYRFNPKAATLDLVLAFAMMGTASFMSRLAGDQQSLIPLYLIGYGIAVWSSGYIERLPALRNRSSSLWLGLGLSYVLLGQYPGMGEFTWVLSLAKDTFYWILLHRISSYIQSDTPQEIYSSVYHARAVQMIIVLGIGELSVGAWQGLVPMSIEGGWRGILCIGVAGLLSVKWYRHAELNYDRPTL